MEVARSLEQASKNKKMYHIMEKCDNPFCLHHVEHNEPEYTCDMVHEYGDYKYIDRCKILKLYRIFIEKLCWHLVDNWLYIIDMVILPEDSEDRLECDRLADFGDCNDNFLFDIEDDESFDDLSEVR